MSLRMCGTRQRCKPVTLLCKSASCCEVLMMPKPDSYPQSWRHIHTAQMNAVTTPHAYHQPAPQLQLPVADSSPAAACLSCAVASAWGRLQCSTVSVTAASTAVVEACSTKAAASAALPFCHPSDAACGRCRFRLCRALGTTAAFGSCQTAKSVSTSLAAETTSPGSIWATRSAGPRR